MLSYRHAYHAGNHADILKHSILALTALSYGQKDKPFTYIDTHAGGGLYDLDSAEALKTGEADKGIRSMLRGSPVLNGIESYMDICKSMEEGRNQYPGSPELVRRLSRDDDQLILMELHNTEIDNLKRRMGGDSRVHIHHRDGFAGIRALTPPTPRRGFALIDPSYETDDDWSRAARTLIDVKKRWPAGSLLLWYPLLSRRIGEISLLKDSLTVSDIPGILCAELHLRPLNESEEDGWGLTGSGMMLVDPPWKMYESIAGILPGLAEVLGGEEASWSIEWLNVPV